ncbi:putative propionyl-CoA carboxylase beta chain 6 [Candidatus Protofrankia californiensis]|uniref:Putative propionyl-CoA carboxylase beta chain 6 n=1 Tax=Candidatus Protofrankia californiensis TaxID=1839754 RepID=A0A1C3NYS7_9ACTN|nr:putative propionyl-CoA carboxylase beta chain 6 [Candidatus Protofrankia californiensis]
MTRLIVGTSVGTDDHLDSIPAQDERDPGRRLARLFDPGSFVPGPAHAGGRVLGGLGTIHGTRATAFATHGGKMGGALGAADAAVIAATIDDAVAAGIPVVGVWHSGGASLSEGVGALDGIGRIFAAMIRASGKIPQLSLVLGPAAGGAAYGPALTDIVVMAPAGRIFVTGPDVVRSVTGEDVGMEELGGAQAHGVRSGVVHVVARSEGDAYMRTRHLVALLAVPGRFDLTTEEDEPELGALLPQRARRAYDVRPLVRRLLDEDAGEPFEELQPRWAANVVVGLGRLRGGTVGVVANNPLRKGGCLDSLAAEKSARFVRMCDAFRIPLVVLVDVPGYLPGARQEWDGVVRRGAKLLYAFAEATVPRVTLITRKSFGGAYIAMNSRSLGATAVLAWPTAEIAVMGAEAAVRVLHRKRLAASPEDERERLLTRLAEQHTREVDGLAQGVELGVVDAVVEPSRTRSQVAEILAAAPIGGGGHGNIPL